MALIPFKIFSSFIHTLFPAVFPIHKTILEGFFWNILRCLWRIYFCMVSELCSFSNEEIGQVWEEERLGKKSWILIQKQRINKTEWVGALSWWIISLFVIDISTSFASSDNGLYVPNPWPFLNKIVIIWGRGSSCHFQSNDNHFWIE